ncbi:hypothetical protein DOY81_008665, partial [Sarcophaga bullata]
CLEFTTVMKLLGVLALSALLGSSMALPTPKEYKETDPELTAGYVEGDMVLDSTTRNGMRDEVRRWPDNIVYYKFHTEFDAPHKNHILRGMNILESVSCIRFKEATDDTVTYVNITGLNGGCYSSVGYLNRGPQSYNLQLYPLDEGCFRLGTIVHEFLHTLGFYHMQSAANRDDYVYIALENIQKGTESNFNKYNASFVDDFDEEYDYGSVLHYSAYAFSNNGKMTIVPLKEEEASGIMGQRRGMSKSDINKLNTMYRCPVHFATVMKLFGIAIFAAILAFSMALPMLVEYKETDPELTAGYVEGDMVLNTKTRNGLRDEVHRWPDNIVYYKFHTEFDAPHKNHILRGMKILESVSCIRFKEATEDVVTYVNITGLNGGCYSSVGYLNKGPQTYNLQLYPLDEGCFRLGTIVHEFLHTLGFYHMQSAANRDDYVYIATEHIQDGKEHNFNKYNHTYVDDFDEEYDYGSVLHYSAYAFSADGEMTIVPLKQEEAAGVMGQRRGMSKTDINKLNVMYRCPVNV